MNKFIVFALSVALTGCSSAATPDHSGFVLNGSTTGDTQTGSGTGTTTSLTSTALKPKDKPCKDGDLDPYHNTKHSDRSSGSGISIGTWGNETYNSEDYKAYKCAEGKWVPDEEAQAERAAEDAEVKKRQDDIAARHKYLWDSLRTKIVTDAEMKEILELGTGIMPYGGASVSWSVGNIYNEQQTRTELAASNNDRDQQIVFNNALLNQFKMRLFAAKEK